jgi:AcrR family transcriptional regulator
MSEAALKPEQVERPAKDRRRQEILDAAFREFSENGYGGTSMEAIARRAKASKETLYSWFKNKETLFNTLYLTRIEGLNRRVANTVAKDPSPANLLPVIAEDVLRLMLNILPLTSGIPSGSKASRILGKTISEERKDFTNYLIWCRSAGYIDFEDDPYEVASLFIAMTQGEWGLRMSAGLVKHVTDEMIRKHAQMVTRMFLKALAPAKKTSD